MNSALVRRFQGFGLLLAAITGLGGCDKPQALGDANAVIVAVRDAAWAELADEIEVALEPRATTVRDERIFRVTQVDPEGPYWGETRRFRQVLLIGEPGDEWIAEALRSAGGQPPGYPATVEARNVWARGQRVIALVVAPGAAPAAAQPLLPEVGESMLADYRTFLRRRMFAAGADTARARRLQAEAGFTLLMPAIYREERPEPGTVIFTNDQPDPSQLQRVLTVTARPSAELATLDRDGLLGWRESIADRLYHPPQLTDHERTERTPLAAAPAEAVQIHGLWSSAPGAWPAGGPFVSRAYNCDDGRTYLLDAWVYAPGREKYEYVFQLETIMDSFQCAVPPAD